MNPCLVAGESVARHPDREHLNEGSWSRSGDRTMRLFGQPTFEGCLLKTNVSTQTDMWKPTAARLRQNPCVGYRKQISRFLSSKKCRRTVFTTVDHVANTSTSMAYWSTALDMPQARRTRSYI